MCTQSPVALLLGVRGTEGVGGNSSLLHPRGMRQELLWLLSLGAAQRVRDSGWGQETVAGRKGQQQGTRDSVSSQAPRFCCGWRVGDASWSRSPPHLRGWEGGCGAEGTRVTVVTALGGALDALP